MKDLKIRMVSGIYIQERPRTEEIVGCLEKNVQNPFIQDVHLFIEDEKGAFEGALAADSYPAIGKLKALLSHPKVVVVPHYARPTYTGFFDYANRVFAEGEVAMISNSDIEYDGTLGELEDVPLAGVFICLSREGGRGSYRAEVSQDTWIWESPIRIRPCDWTLGIAGGDNRIAYEGKVAGYAVVNPCLSIYAYHRHSSRVRHWTVANRIHGDYLSVHPSHISWKDGKAQFVVQPLVPNNKPPAQRQPTPAVPGACRSRRSSEGL